MSGRSALAVVAAGRGARRRARPAGASPGTDAAGLSGREQLARELIERGDWAGAFVDARRAAPGARPTTPEVLTLRGIVYRERGLLADAEADLRGGAEGGARVPRGARGARDPVRRPAAATGPRPSTSERSGWPPTTPPTSTTWASRSSCASTSSEAIGEYERRRDWRRSSRRVRTNLGFAYAAIGRPAPRRARVPDGRQRGRGRRTTSASPTSGAATWTTRTISTSRRCGSTRRPRARVRTWCTPRPCWDAPSRPRLRRRRRRSRLRFRISANNQQRPPDEDDQHDDQERTQ